MAESDNRHIIGVDNGWFGDCDNDADVKCRFYSWHSSNATEEKRFVVETSNRCGRRRFRWSFDRLEDAED